METENTTPKYLWLILKGEVTVFKRPESLYDEQGKIIDPKCVPMFLNPNDSGD